MSRCVIEWVDKWRIFYSSVSLISSITHSLWCTWHFHDKSFCHRTSAPGAKVLKCSICPGRKSGSGRRGGREREKERGDRKRERQRERIAKNNKGVCLWERVHMSCLSSGELLTVTGSSEWIAKVTVFWVTSAVKKTERREQDEEECEQIESKNASYQKQCLPSASALAPAVGASSSLLLLTKRK